MTEHSLWERLVRRAYPAHKLAGVLGRDTKDVQRWCRFGHPHNLENIISSVMQAVPERHFAGGPLPVGWVRLAVCDGGECTLRQWLPLRGAPLSVPDALQLDRLGFGKLMHRPLSAGPRREFALEFHLLPGTVAGVMV